MELKRCSKCGKRKPATEDYFSKHKKCKNGLRSYCKVCGAEYSGKYYKENRKMILEKQRNRGALWYHKNKDRARKSRRVYERNRYKNDKQFLVIKRLRRRLWCAFDRFSEKGKVGKSKEYGIDYQVIFEHIGPCPGPRNRWHIDHIIPLSSFDFDEPDQVRQAFAPKNHQWLLAKDNMKKHNKMEE